MKNTELLKLLDGYVKRYAGRVVFTGTTVRDVELASAKLTCAQEIYNGVKSRIALERDEVNYALDRVMGRLQKVNSRRSVAVDAVASDNLRLAGKELRRLLDPVPADTEPIDIFIFND